MVKILYYKGSVVNIDKIIDSVILNTKCSIDDLDIMKEVSRLIDKYYNGKSIYRRYTALSKNDFENGYTIDFGSYKEFILVKTIRGDGK